MDKLIARTLAQILLNQAVEMHLKLDAYPAERRFADTSVAVKVGLLTEHRDESRKLADELLAFIDPQIERAT